MDFVELMQQAGVDVETTLRRFAGNQGLWMKFVKKLPQEETYGSLQKAVEDKNMELIERAAHTLKGVAANLGFQTLSDMCNDVVWDVRNQTSDKIDQDFQKAAGEYGRIIDIIGKLEN